MSIKRGVPLHDYSYCILSEQRITPVCCYYWGHLRRDVLQLTEKEHVEVSEKWDRAHYRLKYPVDEDVSQTNQLSSGPDWRIQRCVWSLWVNTWIIQETPSVSTMLSHIWTIINSDVCLEPHCSVEAVSHCDPTSRHLDCVGHRDTDRHTPVVKSVFCLVFRVLQFSGLYLLSFFIIILGLVLYSSSSTYVVQDPRVYKQFRNTGSQPAADPHQLSPEVPEPSVTYTSLCPEAGDGPPVHVAWESLRESLVRQPGGSVSQLQPPGSARLCRKKES